MKAVFAGDAVTSCAFRASVFLSLLLPFLASCRHSEYAGEVRRSVQGYLEERMDSDASSMQQQQRRQARLDALLQELCDISAPSGPAKALRTGLRGQVPKLQPPGLLQWAKDGMQAVLSDAATAGAAAAMPGGRRSV